jgi:predicted transposase YdaD
MIYLSRSTEQKVTYPYRALLESEQVQIIYLNELGNIRDLPLITSLAVLRTAQEGPSRDQRHLSPC